jgi:hypothetical protein
MSAYKTIYRNTVKKFAPIFEDVISRQVKDICYGEIPDTKKLKKTLQELHVNVGGLMANRADNEIRRKANQKSLSPQEIWQRTILTYLEVNGLDKLTGEITETTIRDITKILQSSAVDGWNIQQIIKHIQDIGYSSYRGELIARTETSKAANTGSMVGALSTGLETKKEWIAQIDDRTRRTPRDQYDHRVMDGVMVGMDEYFHVPTKMGGFQNMLHPGDPAGSAGDICNCRCSIGFEVVRNAAGYPVRRTSAPIGDAGQIWQILQSNQKVNA